MKLPEMKFDLASFSDKIKDEIGLASFLDKSSSACAVIEKTSRVNNLKVKQGGV